MTAAHHTIAKTACNMVAQFRKAWFNSVHRDSDAFSAHLNDWVKTRCEYHNGEWNHGEWTALLADLNEKFWFPLDDQTASDWVGLSIEIARDSYMYNHKRIAELPKCPHQK